MARIVEWRGGSPHKPEVLLSVEGEKDGCYSLGYVAVGYGRAWTPPVITLSLLELETLHARLGVAIQNEKERLRVAASGS